LVHLVDGLPNRFFVISPSIVAIHTRYRNQLGKEGKTVVSMAPFAGALLETGFQEIADQFADFAGHAIGPWNSLSE